MGSALINSIPVAETDSADAWQNRPTEELRREIAQRLAAHRGRRAKPRPQPERGRAGGGDPERARIAAAVAERYAQAQSYRAFLAAEAERAVQQARAAAEIAARNAEAVAVAQQRLLESFAEESAEVGGAAAVEAAGVAEIGGVGAGLAAPMLWPDLETERAPQRSRSGAPGRGARARQTRAGGDAAAAEPEDAGREAAVRVEAGRVAAGRPEASALRVMLYDGAPALAPRAAVYGTEARAERDAGEVERSDAEALALDEEISFRQAPVFEEPAGPPMPLPANLIEFPRQLVASRKARPRYAEGPLREEEKADETPQLRIFEVEPGQISTTPEAAEPEETATPQWSAIWLDTPAEAAAGTDVAGGDGSAAGVPVMALPYRSFAMKPMTARRSRRLLCAGMDAGIVGLAALVSSAVLAVAAGWMEAGAGTGTLNAGALLAGVRQAFAGVPAANALMAAGVWTGLLALIYQTLFFTFADATPGMRMARIGLCTFSDDNPTRRAMRRRIPALVLSTVTLGLGLWWTLIDEDGLTWHDLISRMYPRSY